MLSNKEFSDLLKSSSNNDDKNKKFDLKQVAQWDRQIKNKQQQSNEKKIKSQDNKEKKEKKEKKSKTEDGLDFKNSKYRDRAEERRKEEKQGGKTTTVFQQVDEGDQNKELQLPFDFNSLEALHEKTQSELKRLHKQLSTNGLDIYSDESDIEEKEGNENEEEEVKDLKDIKPITTLGLNLQRLLLAYRPDTSDLEIKEQATPLSNLKEYYTNGSSLLNKNQSIPKRETTSKYGEILARTVYEFDLRIDSEQDIPLAILRSKKETSGIENNINCILEPELSIRFTKLFEHGKLLTQKQKSKLETKLQSEIVNNSSNQTTKPPVMEPIINKIKTSTKVSSDIYDIYDDEMMIDHVANQNILSTEVSVIPSSKSIKKKISKEEAKVAVIFSDDEDEDIDNKALDQVDSKPLLKGLFSNIKKGISFVSDFGVSSKEIPQSNPKEHVIPKVDPPKQQASVASILGLGFTSNNISKSVSKPHSNQQSSSVSSSKVIHRDIFSNSFNKVVDSSELELDQDKKQGDVFGLHGNYDIYPETGDFETYDSDNDGDDPRPKKARVDGTQNSKRKYNE